MTDDELLKVAKMIVELQEASSRSKIIPVNKTTEIQRKYHERLWNLFGNTGTIEGAVRTVATYMAGGRTLNSLSIEQHHRCLEIMDELFEKICNEQEAANGMV